MDSGSTLINILIYGEKNCKGAKNPNLLTHFFETIWMGQKTFRRFQNKFPVLFVSVTNAELDPDNRS